MSQEDRQVIDAADVNGAVRTWIQRAMVIVVGLIVFGVSTLLGWPWIKELVRGEDTIRSIPVLELRVKALESQLAEANRANAVNAAANAATAANVAEVLRFFPRRPDPSVWSTSVSKP